MSADLSFTAAMVQMRTSLSPEASFKQAADLIREAAAQGADRSATQHQRGVPTRLDRAGAACFD